MCDAFCLARSRELNICYKESEADSPRGEAVVKALRPATMLEPFGPSRSGSARLLMVAYPELLDSTVVLILAETRYAK